MAQTISKPRFLNKEEFRHALEQAIEGNAVAKAPFTTMWANGELTKDIFARWVEQHYAYVGPFADYLAYIYANCPHEDAKDFLLQNMWEEELGGDRHTDLLIRFGEACGTSREKVEAMENLLPETIGLQSWCYRMAFRENFLYATAALVVGLESQVPAIYRRQTPTLREKYGFTDEEVEFFDLHIVSDEIHGERGYQIVLEYARTAEEQQRCIEIVEEATKMRRMYLAGISREFCGK
ncbi:iron-containing redox enzyme family protein [Paenibacillus sp. 7124]|uniref:Iron-containing redox enzyme family protein n=1 Tax=Paenibacillus apii TaxID=1850370 RepID=A0A6M1PG82_9BACL|nr:iron-containing redox enzyme family protein [Paenibacillus apii]NGM82499.1 iron-containing redox enzyme family protein [Paenibacillus apii]